MVQLGYDKIYGSSNPFGFMELISLASKENFFEKRVSNYSKVQGDAEDLQISFDEKWGGSWDR